MRILLLLALTSCAGMSDGKYKKKFHLADFQVAGNPVAIHTMLKDRMTRCYPQSDYPLYKKTISEFNADNESGTLSYEMDNQSMGPKALVMVEVLKGDQGSLVKVYSKGNLFNTPGVYKHHIQKWLDGKKVNCDARGKI